MFRTVQVHGTMPVDVNVDPRDMVRAMIAKLTNNRPSHEVLVKDGKLYSVVDVSYHGSPMYEYTKIGSSVDARMYELLIELQELLDVEQKTVDMLCDD